MKKNLFLNLIICFPVILVFLYFIPFLGVCFVALRFLLGNKRKRNLTSVFLIGIGVFQLIPKASYDLLEALKLDIFNFSWLDAIIHSEWYSVDLIKYSKFLITVGVIFLILSYLFSRLFYKFEYFLHSYISAHEKRNAEILRQNDLIMKEKQEKAKNTQVVYCPYCGADNIISKNGICKYCRRQIQVKD